MKELFNETLKLDEIGIVVELLKEKTDTFGDVVVILRGDLASGKTTFVKEFVKSVGFSDNVTSPTFSIQTVYSNKIYHYDVYNKSLEEFISLGLLEEFENSGIHFVEWGDERLQELLISYGFDVLVLNLYKNVNKRQYILNG